MEFLRCGDINLDYSFNIIDYLDQMDSNEQNVHQEPISQEDIPPLQLPPPILTPNIPVVKAQPVKRKRIFYSAPSHMTKAEQRKFKNRESAKRSRLRRKHRENSLAAENINLKMEIELLKAEITKLASELNTYKK